MNDGKKGKVEALLIKPEGQGAKSKTLDQIDVAWGGFTGDKHFGDTKPSGASQKAYPKGTEVRNTRQISIVSVEELEIIAGDMGIPGIAPQWIGANLLISGIENLTKLPAGSRLHFQNGVGLVVEGDNSPCTSAGAEIQENYPDSTGLTSAFPRKAIGKRGIVAWVERPGKLEIGESIELALP